MLRKEHGECRERYDRSWSEMVRVVRIAIPAETPADQVKSQLLRLADAGKVPHQRLREALVVGWEQIASHFLDDSELDESEEAYLLGFLERNSIEVAEADVRGWYSLVVKGAVLRELMSGIIPKRMNIDGRLPFNFQKSEALIWVFTNTAYYEDRTRRQYRGGSHGASIRVAKGLYYRVGAFRGQAVDTVQRIHVDTGLFAVTTKHLYFAGPAKSLRIRHDKIVSYEPFSDGVGVHRDAATAKPQVFVTGDGWFTYNIAINAAKAG